MKLVSIRFQILLLILFLCHHVIASTDFTDCYNRLRNGNISYGFVDSHGNKVTDATQAVGLTYESCKANCGPGDESFNWRIFSNQFSAWLLPWLALISQLPYGANDTLNNFETMVLTVGSPMLGAYSLALAVTSNRWMLKRFRRSTHRNTFFASKILGSLQQVSFRLTDEDYILPSLILLKENNEWWHDLEEALDYSGRQWTLAAIMSIAYVALAYAFTWVDTLQGQLTAQVFVNGQSIGSIWLSLLPIVTCYLQLSPKTDAKRIIKAVNTANKSFYVASETGELEDNKGARAIIVETASRHIEYEDELCSTPICFYARISSWVKTARKVTDSFEAVSENVSSDQPDKDGAEAMTRSAAIDLCTLDSEDGGHFYDFLAIQITSTLLAVFLQWGTTGAAIMAIYLTPTRGFGCRSASYLAYGCLSTIVWLLLVTSSTLAQNYRASRKRGSPARIVGALVVFLRQLAKLVAAINTTWILLSSLFQFSSFYDNCYCNSSVPGLGRNAYAVLFFNSEDQRLTKLYWIGGMIMATGTALFFVSAINLLTKWPEQRGRSE